MSNKIINVTDDYEKAAKDLAINNYELSPKKIWLLINKEQNSKYKEQNIKIIKPRMKNIIALVKANRKSNEPKIKLNFLKNSDIIKMSNEDQRLFLRFNFDYEIPVGIKKGKLANLILFSHPDFTPMLKGDGISIFIDGTFRCVPHPYRQLLIFMLFEDETSMYIPIIYCLIQDNSSWTYWHVIHLVIVLSDTKLNPKTITCDFEKALLKSCSEQFPDAYIVGCLFHFKQALRRQMIKIKIKKKEIHLAMKKGMIDSLTKVKEKKIYLQIEKLRLKMKTTKKKIESIFFIF